MKRGINGALLVTWGLALAVGIWGLGGAVPEYALPFYLLGAALLGLWGAKLLVCQPVSWVWSPLHVPVLGFALYALVRYLTAPVEYEARWDLLQVLLATGVYFVAAANFYRQRHRTVLVWVLAGVSFAAAAYGLWQFATNSEVVLWFPRPPYGKRASGTYVCPNHLAGLLAMVLAVLLARLVVDRTPSRSLQKSFLIKLAELYVLLFLAAGLYATQSRGGWLAMAVAVVGALLWMWRAKALPPRVVDLALLVLVVGGLSALTIPSLRTRLHQAFAIRLDYSFDYEMVDLKDQSLSGRSQLNATTLGIVKAHPVLGCGPGNWRWFYPQYRDPAVRYTPRYAHNDLLQLVAEYGLVGLVLVLGVLGCLFWQVIRFTRPSVPGEERAWMIGAASALTAIGVHSFFDFNLHIPANLFVAASLLGLTAAITGKERPFLRVEARRPARPVVGALVSVLALVLAAVSVPLCLGQRRIQAGDDALAAGDWTAAAAEYQRAIRLDSRFPLAHARLGDAQRRHHADPTAPLGPDQSRQLLAQAVAAYERALQLNPRDTGVWFRLAVVREGQNQIQAARAAYDRALELDPRNGLLLLRAGRFDARHGLLVRGTERLERAISLGARGAREELARLRAKQAPAPR